MDLFKPLQVRAMSSPAKTPKLCSAFQESMALSAKQKTSWISIFATESLVKSYLEKSGSLAKEASGPLLVDVGGSHGKDLESLEARYGD